MLHVREVFYSIQGEGAQAGRPAVFVRFSGCNLHCDWCDTEHEKGQAYEPDHLLAIIQALAARASSRPMVVMTGGEPTLQLLTAEGDAFARAVANLGFDISVETNGTLLGIGSVPWCRWLTVSPKDPASWTVRAGSELKVVFWGQDISWCEEALTKRSFDFYYLQPRSHGASAQPALDAALLQVQSDPRWRLSVQLHKLLGVR